MRLRAHGCQVVGMLAIFTYDFQLAKDNFQAYKCPLITLSDYNHLIDTALNQGYITSDDVASLKAWREDPAHWNAYV